jgi:CMP-N-acetylneuraminic acid synthetase/spore coat polysaccharide biosynthesis predicted glycosyltransferase SpsG
MEYTMLAVVPARGGSQGVIRKNLRNLNGLPLIAHTIKALREVTPALRIVVSSDDEEILGWAESFGVETIMRGPELSGPEVPVAHVAVDVVEKTSWTGLVGIFQPTSPLRTALSISKAIHQLSLSGGQSLGSVRRQRHLHWIDQEGDIGNAQPLFEDRVNRQYAHQPVLVETGSIQLIYSDVLLKSKTTVSENHILYEDIDSESLDIDTVEDLYIARLRLNRGLVVFRITANSTVGTGHMHHCLQLAEQLDNHEILFLLKECDDFAEQTLKRVGWKYKIENDFLSDLKSVTGFSNRVLINDVLDTQVTDVLLAKQENFSVVNIEDLGPGATYADVVINALYSEELTKSTMIGKLYSGAKFATLRTEFLGLEAIKIQEIASRILITFGGTDPNQLTRRVVESLSDNPELSLTVILGSGVGEVNLPSHVTIRRNIRNIATEMRKSDLLITAAGRTIYEAAILGLPTIAIAQSAREATHSHLGIENGVLFLGIGPLVSNSAIKDTTLRVIENKELRGELSSRLRKSIDENGVTRITRIIEELIGNQI